MFYLDYYYVDVGENYCSIVPKNVCFDLYEAWKEGNIERLKIARELIVHKVRKKAPIISEGECIVVSVNKEDKLFAKSTAEESSTREEIGPVVSNESHDVYLLRPGQLIHVECSVNPREVENRTLHYEDIKACRKKKNKFGLIKKRRQ